jgi:hypothetical protein
MGKAAEKTMLVHGWFKGSEGFMRGSFFKWAQESLFYNA